MEPQRRYIFENIENCRDLGGYPSKYGCTKFKRFIRGGTVDRPTETDIEKLKALNVTTVIDLRGDFEFINQPNGTERLTDNVEHISLYEMNVAEATLLELPSMIPPRIVEPEREVPGISESAWKQPIKKAFLNETSVSFVTFGRRFLL